MKKANAPYKSNAAIKASMTWHPGNELLDWARTQKDNEFCRSLVQQFERVGGLTLNQCDALQRVYEYAKRNTTVEVPAKVIEYFKERIANPRVKPHNKQFFIKMLALAESGRLTQKQLEAATKYMR